jgi:hypothetical protein
VRLTESVGARSATGAVLGARASEATRNPLTEALDRTYRPLGTIAGVVAFRCISVSVDIGVGIGVHVSVAVSVGVAVGVAVDASIALAARVGPAILIVTIGKTVAVVICAVRTALQSRA